MAVSTSSTINDITLAAAVQPSFHDYAKDWLVNNPFIKDTSLVGRGSAALDVPSLASAMGSVGGGGAGVDTEFDATEGTDLSTTTRSTNKVTLTASEYGVFFQVTDNVLEDAVSGFDILQELVADAARILMTAWEDDVCATYGNFSSSAGATGVNLSLANMSTCITTIRTAGVRAPDGLVFVLDDQAASDYEDAILSTNAATAVYPGTADSFLGITRDPVNGLSDGRIGMFRGNPVYMTGLTDTANMGADVSSACYVPNSSANSRMCALGSVTARDLRIETDRTVEGRGTKIVATMRKGVGELLDAAGVNLVTDA